MLIRNQGKDLLINLENTYGFEIRNQCDMAFEVIADFTNTYLVIGKYSTEKKAMKVLDAIARFYSAMVGLKYGDLSVDDVQAIMGSRFTDFGFFQMPADEEV